MPNPTQSQNDKAKEFFRNLKKSKLKPNDIYILNMLNNWSETVDMKFNLIVANFYIVAFYLSSDKTIRVAALIMALFWIIDPFLKLIRLLSRAKTEERLRQMLKQQNSSDIPGEKVV